MKINKQYIICICIILFVLCCLACKACMHICFKHKETYALHAKHSKHSKQFIYCIMITGKDECRKHFAQVAVENFQRQDYPYKKLVIINHGNFNVIDGINQDIFEFHVEKTDDVTLGDLRNIGLEMVPLNALWITWDDDDWRHDTFLSHLFKELQESHSDCITFSNRIEYNTNTRFSWLMHLKQRFFIMLVPKDGRFMYLSKDTGEDLDFIDFYQKNYKCKVLRDNNPNMYIRMVHVNNTSNYVDVNKKMIKLEASRNSNYSESDAKPEHQNYVSSIINTFYKNVPCI